MKILLLGATGQVGHALAWTLSEARHQLTIMVRKAADQQLPEGATILEQEEFTAESFRSALRGMDHVIYGIGLPEQFLFDDNVFEEDQLRDAANIPGRAAGLRGPQADLHIHLRGVQGDRRRDRRELTPSPMKAR